MNSFKKMVVAVLWLLATTVFPSNSYADESPVPATTKICGVPIASAINTYAVEGTIAQSEISSIETTISESGCVDSDPEKKLPVMEVVQVTKLGGNDVEPAFFGTHMKEQTTVAIKIGNKACKGAKETTNRSVSLPFIGRVSDGEWTKERRASEATKTALERCLR